MVRGVLVVDDDREFRNELEDLLDDYEVVQASSGAEAVEILEKPNNIDAVILDVRMPGMDGIEVLRRIKSIDSEVAVIILTGYSTKDVAIGALKSQADDYLEKPAEIDKIPVALERAVALRKSGLEREGAPGTDRAGMTREFLRKNRRKKVTLDAAAARVFLSPKYFSRYFKNETGSSFRDFKLGLKIREAEKLLADKNLSVASISGKLGYSNPESFSRIFRKRTGLTPSQYRESLR